MKRWFAEIGAVILAAGIACGCALVRQAGAPIKEHDLYRRSRTARTLEQRLAAGHAYEAQYPRGAWAPEVRSWLEVAHQAYFESIADDLPALRGYVELLPPGAVATQQVLARIAELEVQAAYEERLGYEFEFRNAEIQCELDRARRRRGQVVEEFVRFVRFVSEIRTWGEPTSSLDHRFLHHWRIRAPHARCVGKRCTKTLTLPYVIPEEREQSARVAVLDVTLELERGGLRRAVVAGPELFSRVAEVLELRPIMLDDTSARLSAMMTSLAVVQNALEHALPAAECDQPPISPVLILRECRGVRAQMIVARDPSEDDRVIVEPWEPEGTPAELQ